jgi:4-amino-4-deoxy-L-arabinose transferase-like glycosyltransferase
LIVVPYALFFLAGLGFGYAAVGVWKWLPLALPLLLALATVLRDGLDGALVLRLVIALVLTAAGVALGMTLDREQPRRRVEPGWR